MPFEGKYICRPLRLLGCAVAEQNNVHCAEGFNHWDGVDPDRRHPGPWSLVRAGLLAV
jgi:hypothetical protein